MATNGTATKASIRGLPWAATVDEITTFFKDCGEILECELPLTDDGRSSGTANITFATSEGYDAAMALNGEDFQGRWLSIKPAGFVRTPKPPTPKAVGCVAVFIGNLSWNIDEETIRDFFKDCGTISNIRFAEDRETGEFRGFGHVNFEETESTDKAVALAGTDVMGRAIRVDFSNPREKW